MICLFMQFINCFKYIGHYTRECLDNISLLRSKSLYKYLHRRDVEEIQTYFNIITIFVEIESRDIKNFKNQLKTIPDQLRDHELYLQSIKLVEEFNELQEKMEDKFKKIIEDLNLDIQTDVINLNLCEYYGRIVNEFNQIVEIIQNIKDNIEIIKKKAENEIPKFMFNANVFFNNDQLSINNLNQQHNINDMNNNVMQISEPNSTSTLNSNDDLFN